MHRAAFATAHQIALDTRNAKGIQSEKWPFNSSLRKERSLSPTAFFRQVGSPAFMDRLSHSL